MRDRSNQTLLRTIGLTLDIGEKKMMQVIGTIISMNGDYYLRGNAITAFKISACDIERLARESDILEGKKAIGELNIGVAFDKGFNSNQVLETGTLKLISAPDKQKLVEMTKASLAKSVELLEQYQQCVINAEKLLRTSRQCYLEAVDSYRMLGGDIFSPNEDALNDAYRHLITHIVCAKADKRTTIFQSHLQGETIGFSELDSLKKEI